MPLTRSVSITEPQDDWLRLNNISLSRLVQKAIESNINSEAINDPMHNEKEDRVVRNMIAELKARGYLVEIRKLKVETPKVSK